MSAVLGATDPLGAMDGQDVICSATSDRVHDGLFFHCTRLPAHAVTDEEHVASGPYPGVGKIAVAAWVDGGAPRVIDGTLVERLQRRGRPL